CRSGCDRRRRGSRGRDAGTTILIKGSRSAAMDKVVAALCGSSEESH
ncbi:hypothetical protein, partial [Pseudomonas aeruginosa]